MGFEMKKTLIVLTFLFWGHLSFAQNFLDQSERFLFNPKEAPRIGLEVELTGLNALEMAEVLKIHLGGKVIKKSRIEKEMDIETGRMISYRVHELHLIGSSMGSVIVKPEDNSTSNTKVLDNYAQTRIFEIVTPPIRVEQVPPLQDALDEMKRRGAMGTLDGYAVAIQVNVEMAEGNPDKIKAKNILSILRNYLKPEHRQQIQKDLKVADFRQPYLGLFTPGMMDRILDPGYEPSNKKFFLDFMYRQSLELLGERGAWTLSETEVREKLPQLIENRNFDVLLPVMKYNYIRVSAVLMFLFPDDWISQYMDRTGWFHRYPILEFREANSDFILLKRVKQFLGIVQHSVTVGDIQFPLLVSTQNLKPSNNQRKPLPIQPFNKKPPSLVPFGETHFRCTQVFFAGS